jgi:para-aminobenzoate synthetase/4-amino-4-deoxychorismate lyase
MCASENPEKQKKPCAAGIPSEWVREAAETADSVLLATTHCDAENHCSYLYTRPLRVLHARTLDEIPELLEQMERATAAGFHLAGYFSYECGGYFQPGNRGLPESDGLPLAWFGVYRGPLIFDHFHAPSLQSCDEQPETTPRFSISPALTISEEQYSQKIRRIQEYLRAGDTYQVNFTSTVMAETNAGAAELFAALSAQQPVAYSALLHVNGRHILSFSPELFFRIAGTRITTRPMKGTMPRGLDLAEDDAMAQRLRSDEKNRAEHVMIVDMLRNDLGRICDTGSIRVDPIFFIEKYRTLFQMTSTITGMLRHGTSYADIFGSIFPGGSITGAPKVRTMQIIRELEAHPRGIYCGAIGHIAPDGSATFNIAIRTLVLEHGRVTMGVGGGIVADSQPADEYQECLLKAGFLTSVWPQFQLLETLLWNGEYFLLNLHLDRMAASAKYFDFVFDRAAVLRQLSATAAKFSAGESYRVRLLAGATGEITIETAKHLPEQATGRVRLARDRVDSRDRFLRHKTTHRERYDRLYAAARRDGFDEVLFQNERGELTEGAISNLFVRRNGKLLTPPIACGLLPGVLRRHILATDPSAGESILTLEDLESADEIFIGNSVRGLRPVRLER